jgi:hypothetical protein
MIIRNFILFFCFFAGAASVAGQVPVDPAIKVKFDSFIDYSNTKQWDKAFNLIYPKLFTRVPKQDLVDMMQRSEVGMTLQLKNTRIIASSSPVQEGNETFVRLSYESDLVFTIEKGGMYDSPKPIQAISDQFKSAYGPRSVQWDPEGKIYTIHATKNMMAIDSGNGDWKLVEINLEQPELMEFLFSPAIMDELVRVE